MRVLTTQESEQVAGSDGWSSLAFWGGTIAAAVGGVFVAPAVVGSVAIAGVTYMVAYGVGTLAGNLYLYATE